MSWRFTSAAGIFISVGANSKNHMDSLSGKWIGFFSQEFDNKKDQYTAEFDFEMDLTESDGGFSGVCHDIEVELGQKERSSINGFVEDGMISFTKYYDHLVYFDCDSDELVLDKNQKGQEITFYGRYDEELNIFSGSWEVVEDDEIMGSDVVSKVNFGYWEMTKKS